MKRLVAGVLLGLLGWAALPPLSASAAAPPPGLTSHSVSITIDDVRPNTPVPTGTRRLEIDLTLRNTGSQDLSNVSLSAERADPISTEKALDAAIAKPQPPSPDLVSPVHRDPVKVGTLLSGAPVDVVYATTTSTNLDSGICLCHDAIYPLYFVATYTDPDSGATTTVGTAQTYLPAFGQTPSPSPLEVTWLWPLLDRPHRVTSQGLFVDDDLTAEVTDGGRLDRALTVVEDVAADIPLTLVVDPDLLDELEVMATNNYRVAAPTTKTGTVPGTGGPVARAWLDRFTAVIDAHPEIDVDLTAYADPDVESLTRNGLSWTPSIGDQASQDRLADALGTRVAVHDVDWPVGNTLSQPTLTALVEHGTSTVVVDDRTLSGHQGALDVDALAPVPTSAGPAIAAVASTTLERDIVQVLGPDGPGLAALPELVSHLAIRVLSSVHTSHYVVLAPPRDLDVDPRIAERMLLATAHAFWNQAVALSTATHTVAATQHGVLHANPSAPRLPAQAIAAMQTVDRTLPGLTGKYGLFDRTAANAASSSAIATVDRIPVGIQRSASSGLLDQQKLSISQAAALARAVDRLRAAVHLVPPAGNASYTLTSSDGPLPLTLTNPLDVTAQVRLEVHAEDNLPGFRSQPVSVTVPPGATQQVRVRTSIDRPGRINVVVTVATLNGMSVGGDPVHLSVRNTALGNVGVAITTVAAVILAIALLVRGIRAVRWRMRRSGTGPQPPVTDPLAP